MREAEITKLIAKLNDQFRTTFVGGSVMITDGVQSRGPDFIREALAAVRGFTDFNEDNDPYAEHDFGTVTVQNEKLFFKIDYYDLTKQYGSEDPSDPAITARVLTLMLGREY